MQPTLIALMTISAAILAISAYVLFVYLPAQRPVHKKKLIRIFVTSFILGCLVMLGLLWIYEQFFAGYRW